MSYIMESAHETSRLEVQERSDDAVPRLMSAGLLEGSHVLDAGCGPGVISRIIADLVGPKGSVLGIDDSTERVAAARKGSPSESRLRFEVADINHTLLDGNQFDFAWSQFVFEYLARPELALAELVRVTRPGGKVVVSDIDGLGYQNFPFSLELESGVRTLEKVLATTGFDLYVGRKLFSLFRSAGLRDIKVRMWPFYCFAGTADDRFILDWETRFRTLEPHAAPMFGGLNSYQDFCRDYLAMLRSPDTLKYAIVLCVEGTKG